MQLVLKPVYNNTALYLQLLGNLEADVMNATSIRHLDIVQTLSWEPAAQVPSGRTVDD